MPEQKYGYEKLLSRIEEVIKQEKEKDKINEFIKFVKKVQNELKTDQWVGIDDMLYIEKCEILVHVPSRRVPLQLNNIDVPPEIVFSELVCLSELLDGITKNSKVVLKTL